MCSQLARAGWPGTVGPARDYGLQKLCGFTADSVHGFAWLSLAQPESVRQVAIFGVAQGGSGWLGQLEGKLGCQMKRWLVGL